MKIKIKSVWEKTNFQAMKKNDELHKKSSLFLYTLNPFLDII